MFSALDPAGFLDCFLRWTQRLRTAVKKEIVAMDGKALRRALDKGAALPYIVSAWAVENGLVLGQLKKEVRDLTQLRRGRKKTILRISDRISCQTGVSFR